MFLSLTEYIYMLIRVNLFLFLFLARTSSIRLVSLAPTGRDSRGEIDRVDCFARTGYRTTVRAHESFDFDASIRVSRVIVLKLRCAAITAFLSSTINRTGELICTDTLVIGGSRWLKLEFAGNEKGRYAKIVIVDWSTMEERRVRLVL